jgi:5-methylthioadenosine/S-adenosylhomocysteine deaminase
MVDADVRLAEATIVIEDGVIVDVGQLPAVGQAIDCRGKLVLPGFVNAHAHTTEVLYRGLSAGLDHVDWVQRKHGLQNALDERGAEIGAALACLEMLRSGAVAFLDPEVEPRHFPGIARAADASGLHGALSVAIQARHGYRAQTGHGGQEHAGPQHGGGQQHHQPQAPRVDLPAASGRVKAWYGPRAMNAMTVELATAVAHGARETGARLTFHCAEDEREVEEVRAESGLTPTRYAEKHGLLLDRAVLAHGVFLEPDDMVAIAAAGASIVHCPVSNAKTGHGIAPLLEMQAAGINVAVGTDGGMSNDTYDLLLELRMIGLVHRATNRDPGATNPGQLLQMATRNGARALGLAGGTIQAGAAADLVILDVRRLGSWPTHDPLDSIAFSSTREVVDSVMVGGELLLDAGRPTRIDEQRLLADATSVASEAARSVGLTTWAQRVSR